jgi:iron complex outermembrane receptor protein
MATGIESRRLVAAAVLIALAGAQRTAHAQDSAAGADGARLEEIIVTAQKRSENLQSVPIAITAVTARDIEQRSIQNVGEALTFAPNVSRASGPSTGDDGFFFFRGLGQVDNSANVEPGVGVYVDDVYLGRVQGASFDVIDVDRIEILRGPQGTLFGRNTIGGAVSVHTRDPGEEFAGSVRLIGGDRNRFDALLGLEVPITDKFGAMVSLYSRNQDGWVDNVVTGDTYGDREDIGGRVKFVWKATEDLKLALAADWSEGKGTSLPTALLATKPALLPIGPGGSPVPFFGSPLLVPFPEDTNDQVDTRPFDGQGYGSIDPELDTTRGGASLHVDWWGDQPIKLRSITAYREMDQTANTDLDGTTYSFYDFTFGVDQNQFSQELQAYGDLFGQRLKWLVGGYYYQEELLNATLAGVGTNTGGGFLPPPGPGLPPIPFYNPANPLDGRALKFLSNLNQDTTSYAAFTQVEFDFTDRLTGLVGLRYTSDEKEMWLDNASDNRDGVFSPLCELPLPPGSRICAAPGTLMYTASSRPGSESEIAGLNTRFKETWSKTTPRFGLNYQATDDILLYASYAEGFKAGGFQGRATPGNTTPAFDPETVDSYELGLKSMLLDNRLRLNAAFFVMEYNDAQLLISELVNGTPQFVTRNAGDSDIKGLEAEMSAQVTDHFEIYASMGWVDHEYTRLDPGAATFNIDLGDSLPNTPSKTFSAGAQYDWQLGDAGSLVLRGDYRWQDDISFQAANNPNDIQEAYGLVDVRATWNSPSKSFMVAGFVRNLTDEDYYTSLSDQRFGGALGVSLGNPAPGRDWGVEVGYRF